MIKHIHFITHYCYYINLNFEWNPLSSCSLFSPALFPSDFEREETTFQLGQYPRLHPLHDVDVPANQSQSSTGKLSLSTRCLRRLITAHTAVCRVALIRHLRSVVAEELASETVRLPTTFSRWLCWPGEQQGHGQSAPQTHNSSGESLRQTPLHAGWVRNTSGPNAVFVRVWAVHVCIEICGL